MTHDYDVTLTYMVRVEAQDAADAERFAIEDVEHGRYDVRGLDTHDLLGALHPVERTRPVGRREQRHEGVVLLEGERRVQRGDH